ncbi:MAG: hypothetical protein ACI9LO_003196 [Planctomycetota bacterium]|jgi:hypothetical protein
MYFLLSGIVLLSVVIALFWLKDRLLRPWFARFVYSGFITRLAVIGAVFILMGLLLIASDLVKEL